MTDWIPIIVLFATLAAVVYSYRQYGVLLAPHLFVAAFWLFWGGMSVTSFNRLEKPSWDVLAIILLAVTVFAVAAECGVRLTTRPHRRVVRHLPSPVRKKSGELEPTEALQYRLLLWLLVGIAMWFGMLAARAALNGVGSATTAEARNLVMSQGLTYGSLTLKNFSDLTFNGALWTTTLLAISWFVIHNRFSAVVLASFGTLLYQYLELGRMLIYFLIIFAFVGFLSSRLKAKLALSVTVGALLLSPVILLVWNITRDRAETHHSTYTGVDAALQQFVDYHQIGFSFLSAAKDESNSPLTAEIGYGRATFGTLYFVAASVFDKLSDSKEVENSFFVRNSEWVNTFRQLGVSETGVPIRYNAYCTIWYTPWIDFGKYSILVFALVLGYFGGVQYARYLSENSVVYFTNTLFINTLLIWGITVSPFDKLKIVSAVLAVIFVNSRLYGSAMRKGIRGSQLSSVVRRDI